MLRLLPLLVLVLLQCTTQHAGVHAWFRTRCYPVAMGGAECSWNTSQAQRVELLLGRMSIKDQFAISIAQPRNNPVVAMSSLNNQPVPAWHGEALAGVANKEQGSLSPHGVFTSFPDVIGLSSSLKRSRWYEIGEAISNEARGAYNMNLSPKLFFWNPIVNLFRDPRWGRGHETAGEDPALCGAHSVQYVLGMQTLKDQPDVLKTSACAKHFPTYSIEANRYYGNNIVPEVDLYESYYPPFEAAIRDANVSCVMCQYGSVNGVGACLLPEMRNLLKRRYGMNGIIVTDIRSMNYLTTPYVTTIPDPPLYDDMLDAEVDVEGPGTFSKRFYPNNLHLINATKMAQRTRNLLNMLVRVGMYDTDRTRFRAVDSLNLNKERANNVNLSLVSTEESFVLLYNPSGALPIPVRLPGAKQNIFIIGSPYYANPSSFLGDFSAKVGAMRSVQSVFNAYFTQFALVKATYSSGGNPSSIQKLKPKYVLYFSGLNKEMEREQTDRSNLFLPQRKTVLQNCQAAKSVGAKFILIVVGGGAVDIGDEMNCASAALWVGYPGQSAAIALRNTLFYDGRLLGAQLNRLGVVNNPMGRATQSWYFNNLTEMVSPSDFAIRGVRGYRYFSAPVLFPFGHGLSYSRWEVIANSTQQFCVKNQGPFPGSFSFMVFAIPNTPLVSNPTLREVLVQFGTSQHILLVNTTECFPIVLDLAPKRKEWNATRDAGTLFRLSVNHVTDIASDATLEQILLAHSRSGLSSISPTKAPSRLPTVAPTSKPSSLPSHSPTIRPTTGKPTSNPSSPLPTLVPTVEKVCQIHQTDVSQANARELCQQSGNQCLGSIRSPSEQTMVNSLVAGLTPPSGWVWMDGNDTLVDGSFVWSDGTPVQYTNWADGEPDNYFGTPEDCMQFDVSGKWNDGECSSVAWALCCNVC